MSFQVGFRHYFDKPAGGPDWGLCSHCHPCISRVKHVNAVPSGLGRFTARWHVCSAACMAVFVTGCQSPSVRDDPPSYALSDTRRTTLGQAVAEGIAQHPGESGFHPLARRCRCFCRPPRSRANRRAQPRSHSMSSTTCFSMTMQPGRASSMGELHCTPPNAACACGLLIDDIDTAGPRRVTRHTGRSFRISRSASSTLRTPLGALAGCRSLDFRRVNRRMHNKSFIADGEIGPSSAVGTSV